MIGWLINYSAFSVSNAMYHQIEIGDRGTIAYSCDSSREIRYVHVPIDSSRQYPDI